VRATPNAKPGPVRRPRQRHSATLAGCASGTVPQFEWTKSRGPVTGLNHAGDAGGRAPDGPTPTGQPGHAHPNAAHPNCRCRKLEQPMPRADITIMVVSACPGVPRVNAPPVGLVVARLGACALWAAGAGFFFQLAVAAGALGRTPTGDSAFTSGLSERRGVLSFLAIAGHNMIPCLLFGAVAVFLTLRESESAKLIPRMLSRSLLMTVPNLVCWWILAGQASSVAAATAQSPFSLMLRLPHGLLEFGALELPLIATWLPRKLSRGERQRHVILSIGLAVVLTVAAGFVEVFVSPALFGALIKA
jgi:hypothetical protein